MRKTAKGLASLGALALASAVGAGTATAAIVGVPSAQPKIPGQSSPNVLAGGLFERVVAQGSNPLENPAAIVGNPDIGIDPPTTPVDITHYGYDGNGPFVPLFAAPGVEAQKTEPDKNTYLVLRDAASRRGPDPAYDYGTHFLFQGHEGGINDAGYITRINLDADGAHRVTLFASRDIAGNQLPVFDGSSWNPFARTLLLTAERGTDGGVWQATRTYPSEVQDISGIFGRAGYESIETDSAGEVWVVEDTGGVSSGTGAHPSARVPNSFVFRFIPTTKGNLLNGGRLQVLQVLRANGTPIRFVDCGPKPPSGPPLVAWEACVNAATETTDLANLHTYGVTFRTKWVTVHDTKTDGTEAFDASALAKAAGGTPFKRPENGQFRPGSLLPGRTTNFVFTETGDTNIVDGAPAELGGRGALYSLTQGSPTANVGQLRMFYRGDDAHTGLDNLAFLNGNQVVAVEDTGDGVHTDRNALDSAYVFDLTENYGAPGAAPPVRLIAEGRDASATIDSDLTDSDAPDFTNDGDNEITGIHVSEGATSPDRLLGKTIPKPFTAGSGWRVFWTAQHGDNATFEILPEPRFP